MAKARSRLKHQKPSSSTPSSNPASAKHKFGLDLRSSFAGLAKGTSSISNPAVSVEEIIPEIEGVLLVTPCAIERYQLNGTIVKRAALPEAITAFLGTKIAGIGRVFLCGTQV